MQRVTYHAVRPISWGLCWSSSLSYMILQHEVSTHSRDSVQFPYVFRHLFGLRRRDSRRPLWWRRRNVVTRHQPSGRPQLRRLTHDDENVVGGEAEMGTRRRNLVCASSDRENQCAGLGTQTGGSQRLSDERRVRG